MYDLQDHKYILYSEVLGRCSNLSLYMYVRIAKFFFFSASKISTPVTTAERNTFFLQPRNFADPRKTVNPVQKELTDMFFKYANKEKAVKL